MSDSKNLASTVWFNLAWCAAEVGLVAWAVTTNATGPGNVVKLWGGICAVGGLVTIAAFTVAEEPDTRSRWLRRTLTFCDALLVFLLAWFGWWWCAAAYAWGGIMCAAFRERKGTKFYTKQLSTEPTK